MCHNVLRVFHDVVHIVSQCFTCFMTFYYVYNVLCLACHATIGVAASTTADHLRDRDNAARIGDNSAEIGDGAAGIVDIAANVIPCRTPS